jgi:hypothetical protein
VKWAKYFLCYLRGAALQLWERCSRVGSECYLRVAAKSTSLNLHEKAVQTKIFLSSKLNWLKEVIMSSGIFLVELLLLWGLALCVCASCSAPSSHRQSSSPSPTHMEKAERNGSSALSVTQPAKTPSRYRVATSPIWATPPLWESSDFILGHRLTDDK